MSVLDRLMERVSPEPNTGCWLWLGGVNRDGYARLYVGSKRDGTNRKAVAHRIAFELLRGPVPEGKELDHLCRVRCCVNPAHLEAVSHAENVVRGAEFRNSPEQARQIRDLRAEGLTQREISKRLGVSSGHVSHVLSGKWPHVYATPPERRGEP